jgi:hypothetical protein
MLPATKEDIDDEVEAALAFHDDDTKATIATLLADNHHLRLQLALAQSAISRGFGPRLAPEFRPGLMHAGNELHVKAVALLRM